jgi:hypothetical protein
MYSDKKSAGAHKATIIGRANLLVNTSQCTRDR